MRFKKQLLFLFYMLAGFSCVAKEKSLSYFIKKYNLPENVNILSVFSNDCINCYYGFSMFLKAHENELKRKDFVFLFKKEAEVDNIFKYQLGLDKRDCSVITDDDFYNVLDKKFVTTLTIIENKKIREQFISKDIHAFKTFAGTRSPEILSLAETDTIDLKGRFGTKKLSVDVLNESKIIVQNEFTNDIFRFDLLHKTITGKLPLSFFTGKYDSILSILMADRPEELAYNLENYKTNDYYKTFPLIKIKKISCVDQMIYVGMAVSRMVTDTGNHITYEAANTLVKLDSNFRMLNVYKLADTVPGVKGRYISLLGYSFINKDTVAFSLSCAGDRKKDSVAVLYDLRTNRMKIIEMSYEVFMPLKGFNGYYNYYHFDVWKDNKNATKSNFTRSPYLFDAATKTKTLLPGLGIDPNTFDLAGKDRYFWISKIFPYQNSMFIIATLKQNEMSLLQYSSDFKTLVSKKKIMDGYLTGIFITRDKLFAFEDYSEKGDVAILHCYKLK